MGGLQNPVVKRSLDESGSRWKGMAKQRQARGEQDGQLAAVADCGDPRVWGGARPPQQTDMLVHRS